MKKNTTRWRSLLYVPGNVDRFISKAQDRGADAIVLDLEDSVPDHEKLAARSMTSDEIPALATGPSDILVRINDSLRLAVPDLEAVVKPGLRGIFVPKCEAAEKVRLISDVVSELELEQGLPAGEVGMVAMIESPRGLQNVHEIAKADTRLRGIILGSEDFATATGMQPTPEALLSPRQQIVFAAHAAGIAAYGLLDSVANYSDTNGLAALARRARAFGFCGATCVHPAAVEPLNVGFMPSEKELDWAKRVVSTMEEAYAQNTGAAKLDGRMIDKPMLIRAQKILAYSAH